MIFISDTTGAEELLSRIEIAISDLSSVISNAAMQAGTQVAEELGAVAPHGIGGPPPSDDGPGTLSQSFSAQSYGDNGAEVITSQGTKLKYVTKGTGIYGPNGSRIYPVSAQALMWPTAPHPFRSVAGQQPNDFVTPVLDSAEQYVSPALEDAYNELTGMLE